MFETEKEKLANEIKDSLSFANLNDTKILLEIFKLMTEIETNQKILQGLQAGKPHLLPAKEKKQNASRKK
ncbi:MAG: hypothetical protein FWD32_00045 [Firmicutes bacterium]|nr:hypothetical protein [Bacillota bacterium]